MFCQKCGAKLEDGVKFCPTCGAPIEQVGESSNLSSNTSGTTTSASAVVVNSSDSLKSRTVAFFLSGFLGALGLHDFYVGKKKLGILKLVLLVTGISLVWSFIDFLMIIVGVYKDSEGKKVVNWKVTCDGDRIETKSGSYFDGTTAQKILWDIMSTIIVIITFGFGYPIAICWKNQWIAHHTVINGRRLKFVGKAGNLFGLWIVCYLLSFITLGIYAFYIPIRLKRWKESNTFFEDEISDDANLIQTLKNEKASTFDGGFWQLFGKSFVAGLLCAVTFGIATPWAICILLRWEFKHTIYNKKRLEFVGKGGDLFVKWLIWGFLTIITFGIYGIWVYVKIKQWLISNATIQGETLVVSDTSESQKKVDLNPFDVLRYVAFGLIAISSIITIIRKHSNYIGNTYISVSTLFIIPIVYVAMVACYLFIKKNNLKQLFGMISGSIAIVEIIKFFVDIKYIANNIFRFPIILGMIASILLIVVLVLDFIKNKPNKKTILIGVIASLLFLANFFVPRIINEIRIASEMKAEQIRSEIARKENEEREKQEQIKREKEAALEKQRKAEINALNTKLVNYMNSATYTVSSYLTEKLSSGTVSYTVSNLGDLNDNAPWVPKNCSKTKGIGEVITIKCNSESHLRLLLRNGYCDFNHPDYYEKNGRVKEFIVTVKETEKSKVWNVMDTQSEQELPLYDLFDEDDVPVTIEVKVADVYDGNKYKDLCIDFLKIGFEELR